MLYYYSINYNSAFFLDRIKNTEDWMWYEKYIVNYLLHNLQLSDRFTPAQIQRCIGLINVNAVALKYPITNSSTTTRKKLQICCHSILGPNHVKKSEKVNCIKYCEYFLQTRLH